MGLPSIVLTPFVVAQNLFGVGYCGWPVEALTECISDQGSRHGMVTVDLTVDIAQQPLPLFDGDAALQDPSVASCRGPNIGVPKEVELITIEH